MRIEDYGLIGNTLTAALVSRGGAIDWLCLPGFDGGACFAALVGGPDNGHWTIAPTNREQTVTRAYRAKTAILETTFSGEEGTVTLIDFMPPPGSGSPRVDVVRIVRCDAGRAELALQLVLRFDYGRVVPWVQRCKVGITAIAGPDAVLFQSQVPLRGEDLTTVATFSLKAGQSRAFCLTWFPSHLSVPRAIGAKGALKRTQDWWLRWSAKASDFGSWNEPALRSLITLKAMTYSPTGAMVAAQTCGKCSLAAARTVIGTSPASVRSTGQAALALVARAS